jgi:hypothetical protein
MDILVGLDRQAALHANNRMKPHRPAPASSRDGADADSSEIRLASIRIDTARKESG